MSRSKKKKLPIIEVVLAEDHKFSRDLLADWFDKSADVIVVAQADNGTDAVRLVKKHCPDVCVMDITMNGMSGIDATKQIIASCAGTKVLALSAHAKKDYVLQMVEAGATGYLLKTCGLDEILAAIRALAAGKEYFNTISSSERPDSPTYSIRLSQKELSLIKLITKGDTNEEIAKQMNLSKRTVDNYRARIMLKLGVNSSAELTKYAIREGIITA